MASQQACPAAPDKRGPWRDWQEFVLPGKQAPSTRRARRRPHRHARAANASASMLRRRVHLEPSQLGRVQFSWHVASLIEQADLGDADAADSPVRLVFAFDGDHAPALGAQPHDVRTGARP
ncbi:MAG: DUF3047 domain-containing protein [Comamonadaceae bacterium]|nr:DUF3047 domain-containing protein [Comamonadaceae bacterium]